MVYCLLFWPSAVNVKPFHIAQKRLTCLRWWNRGYCTLVLVPRLSKISQCHLTRSGTGWRTCIRISRLEDEGIIFCSCSICLRILIKLSVLKPKKKPVKGMNSMNRTEIVFDSLPTSSPQSQTFRSHLSIDDNYVEFYKVSSNLNGPNVFKLEKSIKLF